MELTDVLDEPQTVAHKILGDLGEIKGKQLALDAKIDANRTAAQAGTESLRADLLAIKADITNLGSRVTTLEAAKIRQDGQFDGGAKVINWTKGLLILVAGYLIHAAKESLGIATLGVSP